MIGERRTENGWSKKPVRWEDDEFIYYSIVFSWDMPKVKKEIEQRDLICRKPVFVGGPAVLMNPEFFKGLAIPHTTFRRDVLQRHNYSATRTSIGCPKSCKFCAVPKIEPEFRELKDWIPAPIVCDNNLLATSQKHFSKVIESLRIFKEVDFNQGLDFKYLLGFHIDLLKKLNLKNIRLAWDTKKDERNLIFKIERIIGGGFSKRKISVYVLIGFDDSPDEAMYKFNTLKKLGISPFPMRYQPLDTLKKNSYVAPDWTNEQLIRFSQYWSHRKNYHIPFDEFMPNPKYDKFTMDLEL